MKQSPRNKWMRRFEELILQRPEMADKRIDWQEAITLHSKGLTELQAAKEYKKASEIYKSKLLTVGGIL
jgi:hypothetical protein